MAIDYGNIKHGDNQTTVTVDQGRTAGTAIVTAGGVVVGVAVVDQAGHALRVVRLQRMLRRAEESGSEAEVEELRVALLAVLAEPLVIKQMVSAGLEGTKRLCTASPGLVAVEDSNPGAAACAR